MQQHNTERAGNSGSAASRTSPGSNDCGSCVGGFYRDLFSGIDIGAESDKGLRVLQWDRGGICHVVADTQLVRIAVEHRLGFKGTVGTAEHIAYGALDQLAIGLMLHNRVVAVFIFRNQAALRFTIEQ